MLSQRNIFQKDWMQRNRRRISDCRMVNEMSINTCEDCGFFAHEEYGDCRVDWCSRHYKTDIKFDSTACEHFESTLESTILSYRKDPLKFAKECLGVTLHPYQEAVAKIYLTSGSDSKSK